MTIALLLILFWSVLFFSGWQTTRWVLKDEKRIEVLAPLSFVVGAAGYIFFLNVISYFIPVEISFYLVLVVFAISASVIFKIRKPFAQKAVLGLNKKMAAVIFVTTGIIMFFHGLGELRTIEGDTLAAYHLPLAASIAGGNFPVMQLNLPGEAVAYHYGSDLFLASMSKISGLPVWFAHDVNAFLFAGVIFLMLFCIARHLLQDDMQSYFVAAAALFAGGVKFVYGFSGAAILFDKFVLHQNIAHPFAFLGLMWSGPSAFASNSFIANLNFLWGPIGWSSMLAVILLYIIFIESGGVKKRIIPLIILLLSVLALNIENAFAVLLSGIFLFPFAIYLIKRDKINFKKIFWPSFLVAASAAIIGLVQGGTATVLLKQAIFGGAPANGAPLDFGIFRYPFAFFREFSGPVPIYSKPFFIAWGLLYVLIIPAGIYFFKKRKEEEIFLLILAAVAFSFPLIFSFNDLWQATISKFFYITHPLFALLVGAFLFSLAKKDDWRKIAALAIIFIISVDGLFYLFTRWTYPGRVFGSAKSGFVGMVKKPSPAHSEAYAWVRENSRPKDYFLVFSYLPNTSDIINIQNYEFILYTGRMAPIYSEGNNFINMPNPKHPLAVVYKKTVDTCASDLLKDLKYGYLFADKNWPAGLEEKCLKANSLEKVFDENADGDFARIYKVK
jgi:hypothetical protein